MNRIIKAITEHQLLEDTDKIVVGLSGGADSVALVHYLKFVLKYTVVACHVNHNLRGDESERDMQFVKRLCKKWDIPLVVESVDITAIAQQNRLSLEQAGRQVRYGAFDRCAQKHMANKIATAHTLSDNAETMLYNLTRGTGLKGLCGIPIKRGNIVRPLLYQTRQQIETYCVENNLEYVTDSTNLEAVYTRNKIRLEVFPKLLEVNPQILTAMSRSISILNNEQDFMNCAVTEAYDDVKKQDGLSTERLCKYHVAIRHRVIALFLEINDLQKSNDLIEKLDKIVRCDKGKINVKDDIFIEVKKHTLIMINNKLIVEYFEQEVEFGQFILPTGKRYTIKLLDIANNSSDRDEFQNIRKIYRKLLYMWFDYDKIEGKLFIRQRKSGDKILVEGREGTRAVKKLFIDDKLTAAEKSQILVFADAKSVVAVEEYGCDKRVACDPFTKQVLMIIREEF